MFMLLLPEALAVLGDFFDVFPAFKSSRPLATQKKRSMAEKSRQGGRAPV
jgi:hypothetical protein